MRPQTGNTKLATPTALAAGDELGGFTIRDRRGVSRSDIDPRGFALIAGLYGARDTITGRDAVLKVFHREYRPEEPFARRFLRNGKHAASFRHPNIVSIYDVGLERGCLYLAMEMVDGVTLMDRIVDPGISAERALELLASVAEGLDAAHAAGLVHGDIRPETILIDGGGVARLAPLSVLRRPTGISIAGAPSTGVDYASPEQLLGRRLSGAADVYSLTAVLFSCLTHQFPFPGDTDAAIELAHLELPPPALASFTPPCPPLDAVFARGMAKDPGRRYSRAWELMEGAADALQGLPAAALHGSPTFISTLPDGLEDPLVSPAPEVAPVGVEAPVPLEPEVPATAESPPAAPPSIQVPKLPALLFTGAPAHGTPPPPVERRNGASPDAAPRDGGRSDQKRRNGRAPGATSANGRDARSNGDGGRAAVRDALQNGAGARAVAVAARPAPAATTSRVRRRRTRLLWLLAGLAIAVAAAVASGALHRGGAAVTGSGPLSAGDGPLTVRYPTPSWHAVDTVVPGGFALVPDSAGTPIALASGQATFAAGPLRRSAPIPGGAPPALLARYGRPATVTTSVIAGHAARLYQWVLHPHGVLAAFVLPTTAYDLALICAAPGQAGLSSCNRLASSLSGVAVMIPGPDTTLGGALRRAVAGAASARSSLHGLATGTLAARGATARSLAGVERRAQAAIGHVSVPGRYRLSVGALAHALASEQAAFTRLATVASASGGADQAAHGAAARSGSGGSAVSAAVRAAYDAARLKAMAASRLTGAAAAALRRAGLILPALPVLYLAPAPTPPPVRHKPATHQPSHPSAPPSTSQVTAPPSSGTSPPSSGPSTGTGGGSSGASKPSSPTVVVVPTGSGSTHTSPSTVVTVPTG